MLGARVFAGRMQWADRMISARSLHRSFVAKSAPQDDKREL